MRPLKRATRIPEAKICPPSFDASLETWLEFRESLVNSGWKYVKPEIRDADEMIAWIKAGRPVKPDAR